MLKSMTGFSRAHTESDAYEVVVEIRTVNHRYLDVKTRGPGGLSSYEKQVRDRIARELGRGKVDVNVRVKPQGESVHEIDVDRPLMKEFVRVATELAQASGVGATLQLSDLLAFSPAFQVRERDLSDGSALWDAVEPALSRALDALGSMREAEGAEMMSDFEGRISTLADHVARVEALSEQKRESRRAELEAKVAEIVGAAVEPATIAMEVARLVERGDVTEEVTRFRSHLELWKGTVNAGGPCGKKLDFIVQEMNREVNTIGSKCQDAEIAEHVIAMKSEIERVREQVQNIE
jgi:uncharacterized protein (TIGR00255 family)